MDKFEEMKKEAREQMAVLCENPVEDSHRGMHEALAYVFRHGNCSDKANAVLIAGQWMWADCEMRYHEMKDAEAKH